MSSNWLIDNESIFVTLQNNYVKQILSFTMNKNEMARDCRNVTDFFPNSGFIAVSWPTRNRKLGQPRHPTAKTIMTMLKEGQNGRRCSKRLLSLSIVSEGESR